ncbi:MAG: dynamin family protein [Rivularia sp. (in: cyanobacteria)]
MNEFSLEKKVNQLFISAFKLTQKEPSLKNFYHLLQQCYHRLQQPMRVAIVGKIKAGKSTMMNALLGEALVATGSVEATFNINWLKYDENKTLKVHFKDNRTPETKSVEELSNITVRADENRDYLLSVKYIEVFYPNKILKSFNLIDTPGLQSHYKDDSQNTVDFLQLHGDNLTEITQKEAQGADALLYLFSHSLAMDDSEIVKMFQGPVVGQATPINAIGVLTKVETYWTDPNVSEPMEAGKKVCQRLSAHPKVRDIFYTVYPTCGLLALGAQTLTDNEWEILKKLAELPQKRMESLIGNVKRFCNREYEDVPIPPTERQQVLNQLGQYGVWLAYNLIGSGVNQKSQLIEELLQSSGVPELRKLITSHFGHRAYLIKLGTVLQQIGTAYFREVQNFEGKALEIIQKIGGKFEELQTQEHGFSELQVLRNHYENRLNFDDNEVQQLLYVTGEYGISCAQRLGLEECTSIEEMIPVARQRMNYWRQKAMDYFSNDSISIAAASVLARSYEGIFYRVQKAKEYLYF